MQLDFTSQRIDFSAMIMMMGLRIIGCAFNYADGQEKDKKKLHPTIYHTKKALEKFRESKDVILFCDFVTKK
jgi:hypothetical protein